MLYFPFSETTPITKNPFNPHWRPHWSNADLYELDYLADFITLDNSRKKITTCENVGLGRNVNLFDDLRHYAYKNVLKFKEINEFHHWMNEIENQAINLNVYSNPTNLLPFNEIKATARSVGKWVWKNFSKEKFSNLQSVRGKRNQGKSKSTNKKNEIDNILKLEGIL
ncbi:primase C-terminal domain-containing protein [Providencia rettgeri]|nr:primase C-terminal domain-containing protein [Providencia rettgeri]